MVDVEEYTTEKGKFMLADFMRIASDDAGIYYDRKDRQFYAEQDGCFRPLTKEDVVERMLNEAEGDVKASHIRDIMLAVNRTEWFLQIEEPFQDHIVAFNNGYFDMTTGKFNTGSFFGMQTRKYIPNTIEVNPEDVERCREVLMCIANHHLPTYYNLLEDLGHGLFPDKSLRTYTYKFGLPGTGKSMIMEIQKAIYKDNYKITTWGQLMEDKYVLNEIGNAMMLIVDDASNQGNVNVDRLKSIISSNEFSGPVKYQNDKTFYNNSKLSVGSNDVSLTYADMGVLDRQHIISLQNTNFMDFVGEDRSPEVIQSKVGAWSLLAFEGQNRLLENRKFTVNEVSESYKLISRDDGDITSQFLTHITTEMNCRFNKNVTAQSYYDHFRAFCERIEHVHKVPTRNQFYRGMERLGWTKSSVFVNGKTMRTLVSVKDGALFCDWINDHYDGTEDTYTISDTGQKKYTESQGGAKLMDF